MPAENIATVAMLTCLLACTAVSAGDYQPDPAVKYTLVAPIESPAAATAAEDRWVDSLTANLRKGGAHPNVIYRFARSAARFSINGAPQEDLVFVSRDDPEIYFVVNENYARFIVNFKTKDVGARNYGNHIFVPPSQSFCVLILDGKDWPPGGIPITMAPGNRPTFENRSVSWH